MRQPGVGLGAGESFGQRVRDVGATEGIQQPTFERLDVVVSVGIETQIAPATLPHMFQAAQNESREKTEIDQTIESFVEIGVSHFVFNPLIARSRIEGQLERLASEVIPRFK